MFFVTYVLRELHRRMRQAVVVALGLALGVGLVVTVAAASAGVTKAQSGVLSALDGVATDVTVTGQVPTAPAPGSNQAGQNDQNAVYFMLGPGGQPEVCNSNGQCTSAAGKTIDTVGTSYSSIAASKVAEAARLRGVAAAAGGVTLTDNTVTFGSSGSSGSPPGSFTVDGTDTRERSLGPLSSASLVSGHSFTAADADANVAVVDSGYATSRNLQTGSVLTIGTVTFTVIGVVSQPQATSPPDVYIPLARAQALPLQMGSMKGKVNEIYLTAVSASDVPVVRQELATLLPRATVTTAASLASQVTGSVSSADRLANDLGRWLAVLVLIAAFAVACLLSVVTVARRVAEFGTLKAIGWQTRRIVAQVLGESVVMGVAGAAAGVCLGFAGVAVIEAVAPRLSATVGGSSAPQASPPAGAHGVGTLGAANQIHTVAVPLHPAISGGVIALGVTLAVTGGLLAGSLGSWRIARLRPADALSRVA